MSEKEPKYERVIEWVRDNITNGTLKNGSRLKSENEFCEMFGISRQTVRRAIGMLENKNIVTRIRGSGTYVGNASRPIRKKRYMNIAVISTYLDSYIFPATLHGIEEVLSENGYMTQIAFTNDSICRESDILTSLIDKNNIDGLIVEPSKSALPNPNLDKYRELSKRGIPVLFFNASYPDLSLPCVRIDDRGIGKKATRLLISAGHTKIAGIFKSDDGQGRNRYSGYMDAMNEAGLSIDDKNTIWIDSEDLSDMDRIEDHLFWRIGACNAVVCYNDEVAYRLAKMCQKRRIKIPEDISVVSIDDSDWANMAVTPFTSFPHPKERLGEKAAKNMIAMIDNQSFDGNYIFDSEPVFRNSIKGLELEKLKKA